VLGGGPDEILSNASAAVSLKFAVKINGTAAGSNFDDEFRRADEIAFLVQARGAATLFQNAQCRVGLRDIVNIESYRAVASDLRPRGFNRVGHQPELNE